MFEPRGLPSWTVAVNLEGIGPIGTLTRHVGTSARSLKRRERETRAIPVTSEARIEKYGRSWPDERGLGRRVQVAVQIASWR
jgi:hypothetical protein